jgi:hypothetical protein
MPIVPTMVTADMAAFPVSPVAAGIDGTLNTGAVVEGVGAA